MDGAVTPAEIRAARSIATTLAKNCGTEWQARRMVDLAMFGFMNAHEKVITRIVEEQHPDTFTHEQTHAERLQSAARAT